MNKVFPISAENANEMCKSMNWMDSREAAYVFQKIDDEIKKFVDGNVKEGRICYRSKTCTLIDVSNTAVESLRKLGYNVTVSEIDTSANHLVSKIIGTRVVVSWDVKEQNEQP